MRTFMKMSKLLGLLQFLGTCNEVYVDICYYGLSQMILLCLTDLKHIEQRAMKLVSLMSEAEKHLSQLQQVVNNGGPLNTVVSTQKVGFFSSIYSGVNQNNMLLCKIMFTCFFKNCFYMVQC